MLCYDSDVDYIVEKRPDDCLTAVQAYFIRDWPYRGHVRKSDNLVVFTESGGCLAAFLVPLILDAKGVQVFVTPIQSGRGSRVTVSAGRSNYSRTMDDWLRDELGAREATT